jgi:hypothetical protein
VGALMATIAVKIGLSIQGYLNEHKEQLKIKKRYQQVMESHSKKYCFTSEMYDENQMLLYLIYMNSIPNLPPIQDKCIILE